MQPGPSAVPWMSERLEPKGFGPLPVVLIEVSLCVSCSEAVQMFVLPCISPLTRFLRKYAKLSLQAEHVQ